MNFFRKAIAALIPLNILLFVHTAIAQTYYRAGDFTITLTENNPKTGRTYRGCDSLRNCIVLYYGTSWRNGNRRGITWENGSYFYVVSWQDDDRASPMYLTVFQGEKQLLRKPLQPLRSSE
ncbi:MAG: hypothetical protein J7647_06435 [Cyanobacteria bacterium SBLK]|nr:hypothetical protein [Cyanobacteria bacterium SBLK]